MTNIVDPRIGEEYEGYILEEQLGAGGMGTVYRGRHKAVGNLAAVKIVNLLGFQQNHQLQERFLREARALYALRGTPHVADILHVRFEFPDPGIITEYIEGKSFDRYLYEAASKNVFTRRQNFGVIIKIIGALAKVHEKGIIHRDLKPENIMIVEKTGDGKTTLHPKLIDFGISRRSQQEGEEKLTSADNPFGSPLWAASELFESAHDIDHTVDIFSMGFMIYMALAGKHFYGEVSRFNRMSGYMRINQAVTLIKDETRTKKVLGKLPRMAAKVVQRCIAYKPADRIQKAEELKELCLEYDVGLEKEETEAIDRGEKPPVPEESSQPVSHTAIFGSGAITARGPATVIRSAETVPSTSADTPEVPNTGGKTKKSRTLFLGLVACLAIGVMGATVYLIRKQSVSTKPRKAKAEAPKTAKVEPPPPQPAPKPVTLPKPPTPGQRPSDTYIARVYQKIDAKCRKTDPRREIFQKFPHFHLGCIRWHMQKLRNRSPKNFDKVTLTTLVLDEGRAHFCFNKRKRVCGKGKEKFFSAKRLGLIGECKLIAYKIGAKRTIERRKDGSKIRRLTDLMSGTQAEKIGIWVLSRRARRKRIQAAWIKSQPPGRMLCFKKQ